MWSFTWSRQNNWCQAIHPDAKVYKTRKYIQNHFFQTLDRKQQRTDPKKRELHETS